MSGLHESFDRPELPLPSDRSTGFVFVGLALVAAYLWRAHDWVPFLALAIATGLAVVSVVVPRILRPLNVGWMRFAAVLSRIMNPIVMLLLYVIAIVPAGLLMQLRHDPLRRTRQPGAKTYWIERKPGERSPMTAQF